MKHVAYWSALIVMSVGFMGCDAQEFPAGKSEKSDAGREGVTIRRVDSGRENEIHFKIRSTKRGWLRVGIGPAGGSVSHQIIEAPEERLLRIVRDEIQGDEVIDRFIQPLFGKAEADAVRTQVPDADDRKLVHTMILLEQPELGNATSYGPLALRVPSPFGATHSQAIEGERHLSGSKREDRGLAAWLYLPRGFAGGSSIRSVGEQYEVSLTEEGERRTLEQVGAVFQQLTVTFSPDPIK